MALNLLRPRTAVQTVPLPQPGAEDCRPTWHQGPEPERFMVGFLKYIDFIRRIILLPLLILATLVAYSSNINDECPVTIANGSTPPGENSSDLYHGHGKLWIALWPDGTVSFIPGSAGEIRDDGSLVMKFPWWRGEGIRGPLQVEGHRLGENSATLGSIIPEGYGDSGFQPTALVFPAEGCWQVTGRVETAELTVVMRVIVSSE